MTNTTNIKRSFVFKAEKSDQLSESEIKQLLSGWGPDTMMTISDLGLNELLFVITPAHNETVFPTEPRINEMFDHLESAGMNPCLLRQNGLPVGV